MMWLGVMLACTLGTMALSDGNTNSIIKKEEKEFKFDKDYCRKNLRNFYFNDTDCKTVSKALERDRYLQYEVEDLMKNHNDFNDSILILIKNKKITL